MKKKDDCVFKTYHYSKDGTSIININCNNKQFYILLQYQINSNKEKKQIANVKFILQYYCAYNIHSISSTKNVPIRLINNLKKTLSK